MDTSTCNVAHTLIDFYAGNAASDDEAAQRVAFETSMARLNDSDAIIAAQNDDGELTLDFTPILLATGVTYQWLLDRLESATGQTSEELTFELREFVDSMAIDENLEEI